MKRFSIILALALAAACGTSYRAERQGAEGVAKEAPSTWRVVERVWRYSATHPDGFTLNVSTMDESTEGICVGYAATQVAIRGRGWTMW